MFTKGEEKERKGRKEEPLRPPASPAPTRTSSPHASGRHPSTPAGQQHSSEEQTSGTHCEQAQKSRPGTSKNRNRSASECPPGSLHQPADSTSHTALTSNNLPDAPAAPGAGTAALTLGRSCNSPDNMPGPCPDQPARPPGVWHLPPRCLRAKTRCGPLLAALGGPEISLLTTSDPCSPPRRSGPSPPLLGGQKRDEGPG